MVTCAVIGDAQLVVRIIHVEQAVIVLQVDELDVALSEAIDSRAGSTARSVASMRVSGSPRMVK